MGSIAIVGVGLDEDVPAATLERLRRSASVVVPSTDGPLAYALSSAGITFVSLADLGLTANAPVDRVIEHLTSMSREGDVAYVTPGYPFMRQGMLSGLLSRVGGGLDVFPPLSPLQVILMAFDIDLTADLDIIDARSLSPSIEQRLSHLIVTGVSNHMLSRRVSERLSQVYPGDHEVVLASRLPDGGFSLSMVTVTGLVDAPLGDETAVYVGPSRITLPCGFDELVRLIDILRSPDGCPWDRAQDHVSLRRHMLEEAYEAVAAIESGDPVALAGELGDVLLQVVLHAQIAAEHDTFTIEDVVAGITEKIRRRHPHVFGCEEADTPEAVTRLWDAVKRDEGSDSTGLLDGIPHALPALMRAQKISRRVVGVGFEWDTIDAVWEKVHEEIDEIKAADPGSDEAAGEIGDLLFTIVNLARKQGIDAEEALRTTCDKFTARWRHMEAAALEAGTDIAGLGIEHLERMWGDAKESESQGRGPS